MRRMLAGDVQGMRIEKRYTRKDGWRVAVNVTATLVRDAENKPMYFQTVAVDIRDRKRNEVLKAARFAVTQALVKSPGWDKAAPDVLEGLCMALGIDLAEYWEVDGAREAMHFITSWNRPDYDLSDYDAPAPGAICRRGQGLAGG